MFPILRRHSEALSLSYVASRTVEATIIGVGAISLLSVVTLRDDLATSIGADKASLDIAGQTLVAIHDGTFLLGPGFCVGVNGILLGWLMYRTGLMPRRRGGVCDLPDRQRLQALADPRRRSVRAVTA